MKKRKDEGFTDDQLKFILNQTKGIKFRTAIEIEETEKSLTQLRKDRKYTVNLIKELELHRK